MKPSKNSIAQALRIVNPTIKRAELFLLLRVPPSRLSSMRYWQGIYNIRPWNARTTEEKTAAINAARVLIAKDTDRAALGEKKVL